MISFQKSNVVSVTDGGIFVVFKKQTVKVLWDLCRIDTFKYGEIPCMLTFFASVDQPDIDSIAVCVYPKPAAVEKLLFLAASPAAMVYPNRGNLMFHVPVPIPSCCG